MRSIVVWLGVCGAASTGSTCSQEGVDADSSSLLQARSVVRKQDANQKHEGSLLQSLQKIAQSLKQDSFATTDPIDVSRALGSANDALATMFPGFAVSHASAQHEVDIQIGEIEACHRSVVHGIEIRAHHERRLAARRAASEQCGESLATAMETEASECEEWTTRADELLSAGVPGCGPSTAEQLYEVASGWRDWMATEWASIESHRSECNEAATAVTSQSETCASTTDAYEEAFCMQLQSCNMHSSCFTHEVDVYTGLRVEITAAMTARQEQYRTAKQAECLVELIMQSMITSTPISDVSLTACDDVSVDDLTLTFPELPEAPAECEAVQDTDPQCDPVPHVLQWTNGQATDISNLQPAAGSPDECRCELVELQGVYSAGHIVRCDNCLDVHRSTEENSCPNGWKLFSPRDREDWDVLEASLDMSDAGSLHAPHMIVDVTRSENGCGGCRGAAMNSHSDGQSSWRTSDGSPWWLHDTPFGEPNGDYHANCYLRVSPRSGSIYFNDANCNYHSTNYLCQPVMTPERETHQEWTLVLQYGDEGYIPTSDAAGDVSESQSGSAKLSDAAINALASGGDAAYDYYKITSESAIQDVRDTIILRVTGAYNDMDIVLGFSDWEVCNAATFEECTTWTVARGGTHGIDTYYPLATQGCDRWFTGYRNSVRCWPDQSNNRRCWATGNGCSLGSHAMRKGVRMFKKTA